MENNGNLANLRVEGNGRLLSHELSSCFFFLSWFALLFWLGLQQQQELVCGGIVLVYKYSVVVTQVVFLRFWRCMPHDFAPLFFCFFERKKYIYHPPSPRQPHNNTTTTQPPFLLISFTFFSFSLLSVRPILTTQSRLLGVAAVKVSPLIIKSIACTRAGQVCWARKKKREMLGNHRKRAVTVQSSEDTQGPVFRPTWQQSSIGNAFQLPFSPFLSVTVDVFLFHFPAVSFID